MAGRLAISTGCAIGIAILARPLVAAEPVQVQLVDVGTTQRMIVHSAIVPATIDDVWRALTTEEGWRGWAAPVAYFDELRPGAIIETNYDAAAEQGDPANIQNTVLAYLPQRALVFAATRAPPSFPDVELLSDLATVIELEDAGRKGVRVTISMMGYRVDPKYDRLFDFFTSGNGITLLQLVQYFARSTG